MLKGSLYIFFLARIFLLKTACTEQYSNLHTHGAAPPNRLVNDNEENCITYQALKKVNIILGFLSH